MPPPQSGVSCDVAERNPEQFLTASERGRLQEGSQSVHSQRQDPPEVKVGTWNPQMRTQEEIDGDLLAGDCSPAGAIHLVISKSISLPLSNTAQCSDKISLFFWEA